MCETKDIESVSSDAHSPSAQYTLRNRPQSPSPAAKQYWNWSDDPELPEHQRLRQDVIAEVEQLYADFHLDAIQSPTTRHAVRGTCPGSEIYSRVPPLEASANWQTPQLNFPPRMPPRDIYESLPPWNRESSGLAIRRGRDYVPPMVQQPPDDFDLEAQESCFESAANVNLDPAAWQRQLARTDIEGGDPCSSEPYLAPGYHPYEYLRLSHVSNVCLSFRKQRLQCFIKYL